MKLTWKDKGEQKTTQSRSYDYRITECPGLEGTSSSNLPAIGRDTVWSGCSGHHIIWSWTPPEMGHPQTLWAACASVSPPSLICHYFIEQRVALHHPWSSSMMIFQSVLRSSVFCFILFVGSLYAKDFKTFWSGINFFLIKHVLLYAKSFCLQFEKRYIPICSSSNLRVLFASTQHFF